MYLSHRACSFSSIILRKIARYFCFEFLPISDDRFYCVQILHRDFKPANVLLDEHYCVKLGDVGLARIAPELVSSLQRQSTVQDSMPVGTFQYLDPEYARTGNLSRKSDVYSLGISMLQLLTGGSPRGVVEEVEEALEKGTLASVLDAKVSVPISFGDTVWFWFCILTVYAR
jgi:serine/threonine protein kinase